MGCLSDATRGEWFNIVFSLHISIPGTGLGDILWWKFPLPSFRFHNSSRIANFVQLGPDNDRALETTFGAFYQLGLSLSLLLRQNKLLRANSHIRMEVAQAFNGILVLVRDVSTYYYARSEETSFDFTSQFRAQIQGFASRKNRAVDSMWRQQLGEDESMDIATLRSWLKPRDRMLEKLHQDRVLSPDHRDEYTCEWFQRELLDFSRSSEDILALFGPEGCGKSYLSRWILERLERPLSKKIREYFPINSICSWPYVASILILEIWGIASLILPANFMVSKMRRYSTLLKLMYQVRQHRSRLP